MNETCFTLVNARFSNDFELGFTILPMISSDYKERFKAEYEQLCIRCRKLKTMLQDWEAGRLSFEPTCPKALLIKQLKIMVEYSAVLEERAMHEGIEL